LTTEGQCQVLIPEIPYVAGKFYVVLPVTVYVMLLNLFSTTLSFNNASLSDMFAAGVQMYHTLKTHIEALSLW